MRHTRIGSQVMRWALPALLIAYATLHRLGQTHGSTFYERHAPMPGDGIVPKPRFVITHGITIDAPPEDIWPWLVQMGWHRGGWYTARWVDRLLFPANRASVAHIIDHLQDLHVGDFIPDGPPETECGFVSRSLTRPAFSFCIPPPICHWNGGAPAKRRLIGRGSSGWCHSTLEIALVSSSAGERRRNHGGSP
jgi:hypothetical protein